MTAPTRMQHEAFRGELVRGCVDDFKSVFRPVDRRHPIQCRFADPRDIQALRGNKTTLYDADTHHYTTAADCSEQRRQGTAVMSIVLDTTDTTRTLFS